MGDAAHTAHFSIGSGTKLALEDAIDLANEFARGGSVDHVLEAYEARRSVEVLKIQNAARNSTEWFENVHRYTGMESSSSPTRCSRARSASATRTCGCATRNGWAATKHWLAGGKPLAPMLMPLTVRGLTLKNRIVVSPMATYSAVDGVPQDFQLVHLGARALGGAALVFVEMTSPTPEGRITPGCTGLYNDAQSAAFKRIVDFVHAQTQREDRHAARPQRAEGLDAGRLGRHRRAAARRQLAAAGGQRAGLRRTEPVAAAMTRADMDTLRDQFVASTRRAAEAGFDWLELHCAHGYLLASFISPLTNLRTDEYGGDLENRCRYPLEVFRAMRAAWPAERPMSVRISAHDWAPGGNTDDDAVVVARLFKEAGCDFIDVSSGQTTRAAKPVYGRMYQTPFADRIRNEVGIATIAVGAITEADQANSIIAAGRADLCAIARPHLADPAWTLHEAAKLQSRDVDGRSNT